LPLPNCGMRLPADAPVLQHRPSGADKGRRLPRSAVIVVRRRPEKSQAKT